jgi:uncharacterized repeat protein (TIGR04138 family)
MVKDLATIARESKYPIDAFIFVQQGLDHTVRQIHGEVSDNANPATMHSRHIDGAQLCHGLRYFAVHQYGLLARTVLKRWRITSCEDFGRIVFAMVDAQMMHKTDSDHLEDFMGVFAFDEAFAPQFSLTENA